MRPLDRSHRAVTLRARTSACPAAWIPIGRAPPPTSLFPCRATPPSSAAATSPCTGGDVLELAPLLPAAQSGSAAFDAPPRPRLRAVRGLLPRRRRAAPGGGATDQRDTGATGNRRHRRRLKRRSTPAPPSAAALAMTECPESIALVEESRTPLGETVLRPGESAALHLA